MRSPGSVQELPTEPALLDNLHHSRWKNWLICLLVAVCLACIVRVYRISDCPVGLWVDEASNGYNAYSIWETRKDEHGVAWPLYFRAFNEFKNPVFIYALSPITGMFGMSTLTVRLPTVLFGIATILASFIAVEALLGFTPGMLTAFVLAVSPWHIILSRIGYEAVTMPLFMCLGLFFLWHKRTCHSVASGIFFGITIYCYAASKIMVPCLLGLDLLLCSNQSERSGFIQRLIVITTCLVVALPGIWFSYHDHGMDRFEYISVFNPKNQSIFRQTLPMDSMFNRVAEYPVVFGALWTIQNSFKNLSPGYLFFHGGPSPHHLPDGFGLEHRLHIPAFLVGLWVLWWQCKMGRFIVIWFLIGMLSPSVTVDTPNEIRSIGAIPAFQTIIACGYIAIAKSARNLVPAPVRHRTGIFLATLLFVTSTLSVTWFMYHYTQTYPEISHIAFNTPIQSAMADLTYFDELKYKIIVSPLIKENYYIYFLFHLAFPPDVYQQKGMNTICIHRSDETLCKESHCVYLCFPGELPTCFETVSEYHIPKFMKNIELIYRRRNVKISDDNMKRLADLIPSYHRGTALVLGIRY